MKVVLIISAAVAVLFAVIFIDNLLKERRRSRNYGEYKYKPKKS